MTMKKLIAIIVTMGLLATVPGPALAGGHGGHGGGGGGFFLGLLGGTILGTVLSQPYGPVYGPAPRVYYAPPPEQVWVPGRYVTSYERRWVPGHWEVERYSRGGDYDEDDGGSARDHRVWIPGRSEDVPTRVWLPGHWEERG